MKTKEAINYVESKRYVMEHCDNNKLADEVIDLLKRGEKYEQLWEKFKRIEGCNIAIYPTSRDKHKPTIEKDMNSIEQKYLPETVKKTITFTIEAETLDNLGEAINDFEMFWAGYNEIKGHCIKYRYGKEGD